MKTLFVGGLLVTLAQVVKSQVGMMYKIISAEDAESSLRLQGTLCEKLIEAYLWNGEVTVLTSFASVEEAERFLNERCDTEEVLKDTLRCVA